MQEILYGYRLNPITWAYISALMMIGIYFKFQRFWSVRNLDLVGLLAFSPALLLIYYGLLRNQRELIQTGYAWLFVVGGVFLVRLLLDPVMVRRPLLEPNLSAGGLTFTGLALMVFLMANVITAPRERVEQLLAEKNVSEATNPGFLPFERFSKLSTQAILDVKPSSSGGTHPTLSQVATCRTATILAHLAVVMGIVWIGFWHFDNLHTGVAAGTLYLLTFYTSQLTSQVDHVAPAVLLVWAVAAYRRPLLAGLLLGLVGGLIYYPLFLLPLWIGFYWRRGLFRFTFGALAALTALVVVLALTASNSSEFVAQLEEMFGVRSPFQAKLSGFWQIYAQEYRYPMLAAFLALCGSLAIWPAQKNLGTLLSCSTAVMLASQFWMADSGGLYMGWYLPLLILTIFRPNLDDRMALSAVRPLWRRKTA
ncbi:MAG: hypothetical protein LLF97_10015 [Planctomycetaceae bacterium]|nr:hypothetical protein [Planctomycetaceae bacterium]